MDKLWSQILDDLPAKEGINYGSLFNASNKFLEEKKEKELETKKKNEEAEAKRKALQAIENERVRVNEIKLKDANIKLRKRSSALSMRESEERDVRKHNAQLWIDSKGWEYKRWIRENTMAHTGQPINPYQLDIMNRLGICEPRMSWFDSDWVIKKQFKEHYG